MAQIHAALAYYYDHQEELDDDIERQRQEVEALAARAADSPLQQKLRQLKKMGQQR